MSTLQIYRAGGGYDDDPRVEDGKIYVLRDDHLRVAKELQDKIDELQRRCAEADLQVEKRGDLFVAFIDKFDAGLASAGFDTEQRRTILCALLDTRVAKEPTAPNAPETI